MQRPVCAVCEVELRPEQNDIYVVEVASMGPYHIWSADLWKCPGCHVEIVSGFGQKPLMSHFEPGFNTFLETIQHHQNRVVFNYEQVPEVRRADTE